MAALANGDPVAEGDRIQLSYNGPGGWVRLVGMDGTRDVRDYGVWQVAHHEFQPAPFSLEIDGKPGPERFWLEWTSEEPLDTGDTGLVDTENGHQVADFDVPWPPTGGNGVEIRGVSTFEKPGR